jgi:hypothetical protein
MWGSLDRVVTEMFDLDLDIEIELSADGVVSETHNSALVATSTMAAFAFPASLDKM